MIVQYDLRRLPSRCHKLALHGSLALPSLAGPANRNRIANRSPVPSYEIELAFALLDDDRAGGIAGRKGDDLTPARCACSSPDCGTHEKCSRSGKLAKETAKVNEVLMHRRALSNTRGEPREHAEHWPKRSKATFDLCGISSAG